MLFVQLAEKENKMKKLLIACALLCCGGNITALADSSQTIETFVHFVNREENTTCDQYTSVYLVGYYVNYANNTIAQAVSVYPTDPVLNNFVVPPYTQVPYNYFQIKSIVVADAKYPNDVHTFFVTENNFSGVIYGLSSEYIYIDCGIIPTGQALGLSLNTWTDHEPSPPYATNH